MGKIGIFDSGFGGLTVLRGIRNKLLEYDYIYLGDTARTPYGTRSQEVIYSFTEQAVDFLFEKDCELIILACNTASSEALRKIQQEYLPRKHPNKRVLGVVIPACEAVIEGGYKKIGVMATPSTVESGSYLREIKKLDEGIKIKQQACPLLVPIIESGNNNKEILNLALKDYLTSLGEQEAIILGCTHYEIVENEIKSLVGRTAIISQSRVVSDKLSGYLKRHQEIERKLTKKDNVTYYSTDITDNFKVFGEQILGEKIVVSKISFS